MSNGEQPNHIRITLEIPPNRLSSFLSWAGTLAMVPHKYAVETVDGGVPVAAAEAVATGNEEPVPEPPRLYKLTGNEGVTWVNVERESERDGHDTIPVFTSDNFCDFAPRNSHMMPAMYNKLVAECRRRPGFSERYLCIQPKNGAVLGLQAYTFPGLVEAFKQEGGAVVDSFLNISQWKTLDRMLEEMYLHDEVEPTPLENKQKNSA